MEAALLQYLLQKGCRTVTQVCDFLRTVGGDVADDRVEQLRLRINKDLKFADIEVRRMTSPVTHVAPRNIYLPSWSPFAVRWQRLCGTGEQTERRYRHQGAREKVLLSTTGFLPTHGE